MRRRMWAFRLIETNALLILTPWFSLWASHGGRREAEDVTWWGVEARWKRDYAAPASCYPFERHWRWDFRVVTDEVTAQGFETFEAYQRWLERTKGIIYVYDTISGFYHRTTTQQFAR